MEPIHVQNSEILSLMEHSTASKTTLSNNRLQEIAIKIDVQISEVSDKRGSD